MLNLIFIEKLPVSYKKFFGGVLSFLKIILANTLVTTPSALCCKGSYRTVVHLADIDPAWPNCFMVILIKSSG